MLANQILFRVRTIFVKEIKFYRHSIYFGSAQTHITITSSRHKSMAILSKWLCLTYQVLSDVITDCMFFFVSSYFVCIEKIATTNSLENHNTIRIYHRVWTIFYSHVWLFGIKMACFYSSKHCNLYFCLKRMSDEILTSIMYVWITSNCSCFIVCLKSYITTFQSTIHSNKNLINSFSSVVIISFTFIETPIKLFQKFYCEREQHTVYRFSNTITLTINLWSRISLTKDIMLLNLIVFF